MHTEDWGAGDSLPHRPLMWFTHTSNPSRIGPIVCACTSVQNSYGLPTSRLFEIFAESTKSVKRVWEMPPGVAGRDIAGGACVLGALPWAPSGACARGTVFWFPFVNGSDRVAVAAPRTAPKVVVGPSKTSFAFFAMPSGFAYGLPRLLGRF
jgi:hypothetical protein